MLPIVLRLCMYTAARVDGAPFSAVGVGVMQPIFLVLPLPSKLMRGHMLPLFLQLVKVLCSPFTAVGVCAAIDTAARVDDAPFFRRWRRRYAVHVTAVGVRSVIYTTDRVDAAFLFLIRLIWTFPCRYNAAMVDTAFLLELL